MVVVTLTRVILESPYGTNPDGSRCTPQEIERNINYAIRAMEDSLLRNEAPFLSHLLYTRVLDDMMSKQRELGMQAGWAWGAVADLVVVYVDYGITSGMIEGIHKHQQGRPYIKVAKRSIGRNDGR